MYNKIQEQLKDAMRAKDSVRLTTLRGILAAFTNEAVAKGKTPKDRLNDEEAIVVIKRLVKQRKDSIEQFKKGNREDLVKNEEAELKILEEYLPAQMSEDKIKEIVKLKIEEFVKQNGSASSPQVGQFMGAVMKEIGSQADGAIVKKIVEENLN
ncbi:MAG: GatB/YqeY domain-containing protein [Candidatus Zambryskibacteria bacterium]|nr:GatB/YqeY domain-containing protein [Candidatus Zambryskibacteria bacterium]